jgi:peptidoglycan biosynthesis protein MviN/MurJ (putative lipid II flippase)
MPSIGLGGIALAAAVAKAVKVLALLLFFERKVPTYRLATLGPFAGQMGLASLLTAAALFGLSSLVPVQEIDGLVALAVYLAGAGAVAGGVFAVAAYLLKVDEIRDLLQRGSVLWNRFAKGLRRSQSQRK